MSFPKILLKGVAKYSLEIAISLLLPLVKAATPHAIEQLKEALLKFHQAAKETANPYDDLLADFLLDIFGIDNPDK